MADRVRMYHPKIPGTRDNPVYRPRGKYEDVWKGRGWRLWPPRKKKAAEEKETEQ